jgi:hypothetical protein
MKFNQDVNQDETEMRSRPMVNIHVSTQTLETGLGLTLRFMHIQQLKTYDSRTKQVLS